MITNIPDKIYKFFVLIGILLIGYSYIKSKESYDVYLQKYSTYDKINDSLNILNEYLAFEKTKLRQMSDKVELEYDLDSIYYTDGNYIIFSNVLTKNKNLKIEILNLENQWGNIQYIIFKRKLLETKMNAFVSKHSEFKNDLTNWVSEYDDIYLIGIILACLGIILWLSDSYGEFKIIKQFEKVYILCQSCGLEFNSIRTYGKNSDKTNNYAFCSKCFEDGKFTEPNLTKKTALNRLIKSKKAQNKLSKYLLLVKFKKLERWLN